MSSDIPGSSSPAPASKPAADGSAKGKGAKQPPPPAQPAADADSKQQKSGKDAKKEKRAAAVAARAAAEGGQGEGSGAPSGQQQRSQGQSQRGQGQGQAGPSGTQQKGKEQAAAGGASHGPSAAAPQAQSLLFSHLPSSKLPDSAQALATGKIHPLVLRYGLLIASGQIRGANARVIGLMATFKEVIKDFSCPPEEMHRLLPSHLSPAIAFLDQCRPKGVGGGNAIRWLKSEINRIGTDKSITEEDEQKEQILNAIDEFLRDRIELADQVISGFAVEKINPGDTIVTYARSSLVEKVLLEAWGNMQSEDPTHQFHVIVVDSGPLFEGKHLLKVLQAASVPATYTLLSSLPSVLSRSSLVLLGTAALLSDGALYARAGTAMVALLAKESRIPVVACCETYKFGEKVVLDAVTGNELGDTKDWWQESPAQSQDAQAKKKTKAVDVTPIHLLYDLTPPSLITAVCTEVGFIPPSSVPTVIVKGDNSAL